MLGSQGQLLSVTDNLSGSIFAVSDISGVPIFDVNSSGLSTFDGNVTLASGTTLAGMNTVRLENGVNKRNLSCDGSGNLDISNAANNTTIFHLQDNALTLGTSVGSGSLTLYTGSINSTGTVTATTFSGDLNGTINTATTAVTQPNSTDNTTVATTAYVVNKIAELPAGLQFLGTWNADTNAPTLASGGGERSEGTTTTVTANKLIDSAATFTTAPAVVVGDRVRVVTPTGPEFALVTSVDSATQLTLAADIVTAIGEAYIIEVSPFIPEGNYYIVSTDGATNLNGITDWKVGDWAVASSTNVWQKIDNSSVLDGEGTGQTLPLWSGSGDSNTLSNSILTQTSESIITQTAGTGEVAQYYLNSIADRDSSISFQQATVQKSKIGYDHSEGALAFVHGSGAFSTAGMVLDSTGVGIGTTSPSKKLHVVGSNHILTIENTSAVADRYAQMMIQAGTATNYIWTQNQNSTTYGGANSLNIYTQQAGAIAFFTNGNNKRMTIASDGNVGIGTATPQKKLHIEGPGGASASQFLITGASDTIGDTAGILLRAEAGESDSSLRAKGGIFFEREAANGLGKLHLCNNGSNNNDSADLTDAALTITQTKTSGLGLQLQALNYK